MHRDRDVLKGRSEHPRAKAARWGVANGVHQAVETPKASSHLVDGGTHLIGIGDVEFDDLAHVAELARRASSDRRAAAKTGEGDRGAFFESALGDAKGERVVGQHPRDQDTVIAQQCHLVSVVLGVVNEGRQ
jgi:hypothetical protein